MFSLVSRKFLAMRNISLYSVFHIQKTILKYLSNKSMVSVKVGHADLASATSFDVESMVAHPNYEKTRMGPIHDIALIKLSEHLEFDDKIAPICLPQNHTEDDLVDEDKTLLG